MQTSIYVARGMLVESTKPTWFYGTSSEHSVYYQYEFHKAANVLAGMIQTEEPYYQPTPVAPQPFERSVGVFRGDPTFRCTQDDPCDSGWGLRILESSDITILGAGLYSWFSTYAQDCLATSSCQRTMAEIVGNHGDIIIHNLVTIGAVNMIKTDSDLITAKGNQAVDSHPYWSQLSRFEAREFKKAHSPIVRASVGDDMTDAIARLEADLATSCRMGNSCVDINDREAPTPSVIPTKPWSVTTRPAVPPSGRSLGSPSAASPEWRRRRASGGPTSTPGPTATAAAPRARSTCSLRRPVVATPGTRTTATRAGVATSRFAASTLATRPSLRVVRGESGTHGWFCFSSPCPPPPPPYQGAYCGALTLISSSSLREPQCPSGQDVIQQEFISLHGVGCATYSNFCCSRKQLSNCHWVGQGDCADVSKNTPSSSPSLFTTPSASRHGG